MRTNVLSWASAAGIALAAAVPLSAAAQSEPDVRAIRPALMLLLDSSGSMEFTAQGADPVCTGGAAGSTRNRWAMVVEALAGEYANFFCTSMPRNTAGFVGAPDFNYHIPYHQPSGASLGNGILSIYGDRVKFGLMTFDTLPATQGQFIDAWLTQAACRAADGAASGDYSYGDCRNIYFEGCTHSGYWINHGARRELGDVTPDVPDGVLDTPLELMNPFDGAMVSVGPPTDDPADLDTTRNRIVASLATRRPFGPTPLAAQIDDALQYFSTHPDVRPGSGGDGYYECRTRFVIILSDGRPNLDFRDDPINCDQGTSRCPYPLPVANVNRLYEDHNVRTAVIGFAATGEPDFPQMRAELEAIAAAGRTDDCIARAVAAGMPPLQAPDGSASRVFWATNRAQLMNAMSAIIDACVNTVPTSRTRTSFAPISSASGGQYQIQSSFQVGAGEPWRGFLERRRFTCNIPAAGPPTVVDQPLDTALGDDIAFVLNNTATRNILTAVGSFNGYGTSGCTAGVNCIAAAQGNLYRTDNAGGLASVVALDNGAVTAEDMAILGGTAITRSAARTQVLNYVYARAGAPTRRLQHKLGDIYRSSPTVMTAPTLDIADQSFNDFRAQPLRVDATFGNRWVGAAHPTNADRGRPGAIYVGTNDGLLHGFELEADTASGVPAGRENWAFVPPYHLPRLRDQLTTHQWYVDGTPAVRDVRFSRTESNTNDFRQWRTILTVGMRAGGTSYTTLDVTNPRSPDFLWQFSGESANPSGTAVRDARWLRRMGLTGSVAAITSLNVRLPALATNDVFGRARRPELVSGERGVVLIAGGLPQQCEPAEVGCTAAQYRADPSQCTCVHFQDSIGCEPDVTPATLGIGGVSPDGIGATSSLVRDEMRCYGAPQGKYLWVVDAETGYVLKEFGPCSIGRTGGAARNPTVSPAGQCIDAPITGSVAPFPGLTGTVSTRAYAGDAEGRVWRFDFSDPDPAQWRAGVLYDLYFDQSDAGIAQRIVEAPVVSVDPQGNPVIVVGSGDPDLLEGRDMNRIASITELPTYNATGAITSIRARENWRIQLAAGERLTGPIELFNNAVYFGTFNASSATDLCDFGEGSVWGVDYRLASNVTGGHALPKQRLPLGAFTRCTLTETPSANGEVRCVSAGDNSVVFGVGITQRPTCIRGTDETIPGLGSRFRVQEVGGGNFDLVIQTGRGGAGAPAGGWITNTTTVPLQVPTAFSRVDSWYSLIE
ncbi:MAG: hypothetical protein IT379_06405 [Deltaproteobacteria bacterium]|nr:hypothetical protein [Deltaproteobacteria bacterium]